MRYFVWNSIRSHPIKSVILIRVLWKEFRNNNNKTDPQKLTFVNRVVDNEECDLADGDEWPWGEKSLINEDHDRRYEWEILI